MSTSDFGDWNFTPSAPFMFFGTDVNGNHVYRVYNHPRKFVALGFINVEQMTVNRRVGSQYSPLDYSMMFVRPMEDDSQ